MDFEQSGLTRRVKTAKYRDSGMQFLHRRQIWLGRWQLKRAANRIEWKFSGKLPVVESPYKDDDHQALEYWRSSPSTGEVKPKKIKRKITHRNKCGWVMWDNSVKIRRYSSGAAQFSGVCSCGSVWECPRCASKRQAERASELRFILSRWHTAQENRQAYLVTLTIPHHFGEGLKELKGFVSEAWTKMFAHRGGKRLLANYGCEHFVRRLEVTYGSNGWHPHIHAIMFHDCPAKDIEQYKADLFNRWAGLIASSGKTIKDLEDFKEHGVDIAFTENSNMKAVADYITKMGLADEIALSEKKAKGRSRTPWAILSDYAKTGNLSSGRIWQRYCDEIRGSRQLTWSQPRDKTPIRKLFYRPTDKPDSQLMAEILPHQWSKISKDPVEQSILLSAAECGDWGFLSKTLGPGSAGGVVMDPQNDLLTDPAYLK